LNLVREWVLVCSCCEELFKLGNFERTERDRLLDWESREPIPRIPVFCSSDFFDLALVQENIREGSPIRFELRTNALNLGGHADVDALVGKGVTRLCHFTPAWRLDAIYGRGLLPHSDLRHGDLNDEHKLEGREDHVRLTIEYPNLHLLNKFKRDGVTGDWGLGDWELGDWVVILLDPIVVAGRGTQFSDVNAATGRGSRIKLVEEGVRAMYELIVQPPHSQAEKRESFPNFLQNCPTSLQAEVLVEGKIDIRHVVGIVTENDRVRRRVEQIVEDNCG
jgi:hypothetical protein